MEQHSEVENFGNLLKTLLKEKSTSMGELSKKSGIDKSTISRIANNKQKPNINHLEKIAIHLNVNLEELLKASGYEFKNSNNKQIFNIDSDFSNFDDVLGFANLINDKNFNGNIEKELSKCKLYVQTDEGKKLLFDNFSKKIDSIEKQGQFTDRLRDMYAEFCTGKLGIKKYLLIGSMLLYFVISTDVIPDFVFPIGFMDDLVALNMVTKLLRKDK
ncbi:MULTISPECIES: helix-turn-helix domain-containing protein [unclassified Clostridioides]|uniref:helix-turn-helix domain-containing protein n=1 Tax=unclassified Clostridioides TaxID=2635829 RepID=UPI001D11C486|nr:helix-turn-helix domain-containing protein [Clostridioides sp. ZZV15-6388]MCC0658714.1 helix-turn-helix domain-containing protein [Clostridioides sp. ZZV14-6154]MCC0665729.1 helix-turn-helix domain-containing protein [Clostridioides sp. ZZV15-6597]MCC0668824.1 helix-turn-helix domain-containing protein [Clostridioides sp. ZZV14-6153]MCC0720435.1 helix-turn-helix domain-containing protein [Clostridioides sp. ZZV14-6105]MCC0725107.1 helix-turn-helix domain-containing protein [Clostridioides s